jgi:hypothetical protein
MLDQPHLCRSLRHAIRYVYHCKDYARHYSGWRRKYPAEPAHTIQTYTASLKDHPVPTLGTNEVLIRVEYAGQVRPCPLPR